MKNYITTISGLDVDLLSPKTATIRLSDICHALSHLNRFVGHTEIPISVAAHSLGVAHLLRFDGYRPAVQLFGLTHDFSEAYLGDVPTPLKQTAGMAFYRDLERRWSKAINWALGVPQWHELEGWEHRAVEDMDRAAFDAENLSRFTSNYPREEPAVLANELMRVFYHLQAEAGL